MNILITGGSGFVGSSLAIHIKQKYPTYEIYSFDNLRRRGSELNLTRLNNEKIHFLHGDVRNKEDLFSINIKFDVIIDASADCSVMSGLENDSSYVVNTNLVGTFNCLELAKTQKSIFIFLSTSRVYGIDSLESILYDEADTRYFILDTQNMQHVSSNGITELFSTNGTKSLYGATKLSSELLLQEYSKSFNFDMVINRCGIIAGPWQMGNINQGVVTSWLARHYWKKSLKYTGYSGTGKQVRDILDVRDLAELIDWQIHNISRVSGEIFNVGGGIQNSISLLELTDLCEKITQNKIHVGQDITARKNDIRIYITDNTKIMHMTSWRPIKSVVQTLQDTYDWIVKNENDLFNVIG